jgi:hypothetical protein
MFCVWTFDSDDDFLYSYGSSAHPTQRMICVVLARYFEILLSILRDIEIQHNQCPCIANSRSKSASLPYFSEREDRSSHNITCVRANDAEGESTHFSHLINRSADQQFGEISQQNRRKEATFLLADSNTTSIEGGDEVYSDSKQ